MTIIALSKLGTVERRIKSARYAFKSWDYRLIQSKSRDSPRLAIVDIKSGEVVAGVSAKCRT